MTRISNSKNNHLVVLNRLSTQFPTGIVLTSTWLKENNISAKLAWWYVHAGWLERLGYQVYKKFGSTVDWSGAISALQSQLKLPLHIGGLSALEILGKAHFIPMNGIKRVTLFIKPKTSIPKWLFDESIWGVEFKSYQPLLFTDNSVAIIETSINNNIVFISSPELAILEVLYLVPNLMSFDEATLLMEGLKYLRPNIVQLLLEACTIIKVKRLFLYLADKFQHIWLHELNLNKIELGTGKYIIGDGGNYNAKYKISMPIIRNE